MLFEALCLHAQDSEILILLSRNLLDLLVHPPLLVGVLRISHSVPAIHVDRVLDEQLLHLLGPSTIPD